MRSRGGAANVYKRSRGSDEAANLRTSLVLVSLGSHELCEHRGVRLNHVRQARVRLRRQQRAPREPNLSRLQPVHARFIRSLVRALIGKLISRPIGSREERVRRTRGYETVYDLRAALETKIRELYVYSIWFVGCEQMRKR